jgi:hypothetical protein
MLEWSSMKGGLAELCSFIAAGDFKASYETLNFNEAMVRAMMVFHRDAQSRGLSGESPSPDGSVPVLNERGVSFYRRPPPPFGRGK